MGFIEYSIEVLITELLKGCTNYLKPKSHFKILGASTVT